MNLNPLSKYYKKEDYKWSAIALFAGCAVVFIGDRLLGVSLEVNYGMATYNILWIMDLILVPFLAGLVVSFIYGLGGKILAHFPPLIVRCIEYFSMDVAPDGGNLLPLGFWILIVIVVVEAASAGGFVGEVVIKRTYGRSPKYMTHKRYQLKEKKAD